MPVGVRTISAQELSALEQKFLTNLRQVSSGHLKAGEGYFSPDGKSIIYQAVPVDYPFYQIFTQSLDRGKPQRVSTGRGRTTCSYFSPDGKRILFASSHLDPRLEQTEQEGRRLADELKKSGKRPRYQWDFDPYMEIFEADRDGGNLRQITRSYGYDAEGAYSRDGRLIAFCRDSEADESKPLSAEKPANPDIYLMNADGSDVRRLTSAPGYDGGPFISPDGRWIVFRSDRKQAEYLQIYVIGTDGKNETALTETQGVNWGPYWHPSAPWLIWSGADHSDPNARPNYDLWLARYKVTDGKFSIDAPRRITDFAGGDVLPVFSPDGRQLMWTSTRTDDRNSQLFIADFHLPDASN
ncbi:MAG: biopolymer transporter Tol [Planctomycetes bacterium]|nr:biopolymer transporter Tol [Planctomycetota bacterium]